jgi:hypothetical protein
MDAMTMKRVGSGCGGKRGGESPGGRLQAFMEGSRCYAGLPRHAHRPDFRLVRMTEAQYREKYFWIMDGRQKIGRLNLALGEIELFRFFPPAGGARVDYRMPEVYSWSNLFGVRICIVPQGRLSNEGRMDGLEGRGETLALCYRETLEGGLFLEHAFMLRFDPVLGYVLDCTYDLRMARPQRFEYANMLAAGLSESRDNRKRYQKCIWARRDGSLCYLYQNPLARIELAGPAWADMPDGGFVGWVAEREMNPFIEVIRSTPSTFETCRLWYDHHIFGKAPERRSEDGYYHITAEYRLLSLPLPVAKELEDAARRMLPTGLLKGARMGFLQGVVNDFETPIPEGALYNGCAWNSAARLDTRVGYSGSRSLRVCGGQIAEPIDAGTAVFLESGKRYRFSAWVRTRGVTGKGAYLRLKEVFWHWEDVRAMHQSKRLRGDKDWTRLEFTFEPVPNDPIAVPGLVVDGPGTAWFDDVELVEIPG